MNYERGERESRDSCKPFSKLFHAARRLSYFFQNARVTARAIDDVKARTVESIREETGHPALAPLRTKQGQGIKGVCMPFEETILYDKCPANSRRLSRHYHVSILEDRWFEQVIIA